MRTGIALALLLLIVSAYQAFSFRNNLERDTLKKGRIVLSTGDEATFDAAKNREGSARLILDGDPGTCANLYFPSNHPEGTHLIAELALTHDPGNPPESRKLRGIKFLNGCTDTGNDRIKKLEISILLRRANDPDVEKIIPEPVEMLRETVEIPDRSVVWIPFDVAPFPASPGYPDHVSLVIAKIRILETYHPEQHRAGIRELYYVDLDASSRRERIWSPGESL